VVRLSTTSASWWCWRCDVARRATRVVTYNADVAAWAQRRRGLDGVSVAPVGRLAARSRAVGASSFSLEAFVETYEALYREIAEVPRTRD